MTTRAYALLTHDPDVGAATTLCGYLAFNESDVHIAFIPYVKADAWMTTWLHLTTTTGGSPSPEQVLDLLDQLNGITFGAIEVDSDDFDPSDRPFNVAESLTEAEFVP